jgi:hypothetical protein
MDETWLVLGVYPDPASAAAVAGLLRSESLPVRIQSDEPVPGLMKGFTVLVPAALLSRAEAVCAQAPLSEEEWARAVDETGAVEQSQEIKP